MKNKLFFIIKQRKRNWNWYRCKSSNQAQITSRLTVSYSLQVTGRRGIKSKKLLDDLKIRDVSGN